MDPIDQGQFSLQTTPESFQEYWRPTPSFGSVPGIEAPSLRQVSLPSSDYLQASNPSTVVAPASEGSCFPFMNPIGQNWLPSSANIAVENQSSNYLQSNYPVLPQKFLDFFSQPTTPQVEEPFPQPVNQNIHHVYSTSDQMQSYSFPDQSSHSAYNMASYFETPVASYNNYQQTSIYQVDQPNKKKRPFPFINKPDDYVQSDIINSQFRAPPIDIDMLHHQSNSEALKRKNSIVSLPRAESLLPMTFSLPKMMHPFQTPEVFKPTTVLSAPTNLNNSCLRFCRRCQVHNVNTPTNGHKDCAFKQCGCEGCMKIFIKHSNAKLRRRDNNLRRKDSST